jgi:hypothetical protein
VTAKGYADSAGRQERKWIVDGLSHRGVMNLVEVIAANFSRIFCQLRAPTTERFSFGSSGTE